MRLSLTLSLYIGRQFLIGVGIALFTLCLLIFLFDFVELSRRSASKPEITIGVVLQLSLLHLPYMIHRVVPYAVLVGVMLVLAKFGRTSELVVTRATGTSVWQFLFPGIALSLGAGVALVTVFNPVAAALLWRYEQLEARYLEGRVSNLAVSTSGLWLRQADDYGESVIHAQRITEPELTLHDVVIFRYQGQSKFVQRFDASTAVLNDGNWLLRDVISTGPNRSAERRDQYRIPTDLTISQIQDNFSSPETLSFWEIPKFISLLERAGFSALKHRVHLHSVLAFPLLLSGMVLIGAAFTLRLSSRSGGAGRLISFGMAAGLLLYTFSDVVLALGISAHVPAVLAGWAPALMTLLLGGGLLLHIEDS
jgi:lipopolysaccharide export system permease protein